MDEAAFARFSSCEYLGPVVARFGPLEMGQPEEPLTCLVSSLVSQQLSVKAAATIWARVAERIGGEPVDPERLLDVSPEELRTLGLSRQKARYVHAVAQAWLDHNWRADDWFSMPDDEVRARLLPITGVGPWTVDMFLIFGLHHPDVWPLGDLGIQNGLKRLVRPDLTAGDMAELGERWQPHRSLAARYIWKSLDNTPVS